MARFAWLALSVLSMIGCDCGGRDRDRPGDGGRDAAVPDGALRDAPPPADADCAERVVCAGSCCRAGERCYLDTCIPDLGPCTTNEECVSDSYCAEDMTCVPYG